MDVEHLIDTARLKEAAESLGVRLVVLFGSHAGGRLHPRDDSDVDLAILPGRDYTRDQFWETVRALQPAVRSGSLDLVILDGADPLLQLEVLDRGLVLHGSLDEFASQKSLAYRRFIDSADLRKLENLLFRKRMSFLSDMLDDSP